MAIDSLGNRSSAVNVGTPWHVTLPPANGNIVWTDRQHLLHQYSGISAAAWTDPTCTITAAVTMPANTVTGDVTQTANTMSTDVTMTANSITEDVGMGCGNQ